MGTRPHVTVQPATEADARELAPLMPEEDVREVRASCGLAPLPCLLSSLALSDEAWCARVDGVPVALFGLVLPRLREAALAPPFAVAWLLTGEASRRHPRALLAVVRWGMERFFERAPCLCNWVDVRHERALRLFRHLGFRFGEAQPWGVEGRPFVFVYRWRAERALERGG